MKKLLSIFYINKSGKSSTHNTYIGEWKEIVNGLNSLLKVGKGRIELSILTDKDELNSSLSMWVENNYMKLLMFESESEENEEDTIRSYWSGDISKGVIIMNDEEVSPLALTQDRVLVKDIFKSFFETGNVSEDILE